MQKYFIVVKSYVLAHKILSVVALIVVIFLGNLVYGKITSTSGDTRYITAKVVKGNIVASVSGTGQVSASNQIDIKPKVSGNVVYLAASNGEKVGVGALIVQLDTTDAEKSVRDAQVSLDAANLALEKLKIQNSSNNISAGLSKAYSDSLSTVSTAFSDMNTIRTGLNNILSASGLSDNAARMAGGNAEDYRNKAMDDYNTLYDALLKSSNDYSTISSSSSGVDIEKIVPEAYNTTKNLSDAVKSASDFVNFMVQESKNISALTSYQTTLSGYATSANGDLSSILSAETNIQNNKDTAQNANLDIENAQLTVTQKENALQDAKDNLADYFIRAPYAGTIANMTLVNSDSVSTSTTIATLITDKQIAEISLNEVDVAKIKIGEKATMTFDAVPDLTISGVVDQIDSIGTVSQGVVTYNVKITFDTQDDRVKPAMSVSAAIITDMKQDVLIVPNSAIKSQASASYVEMFSTSLLPSTDGLLGSISKIAPNKIPVEVGLANDSQSEIISGVNEGDEIVTRTILPTSTTTTTAPSLFGAPANRGGAGGVRVTPRTN